MSVLVTAKSYLLGATGVLAPLLPGVLVSYGAPHGDPPRELVHGGTVVGPVSLAAMAGGGSVKRTEELTLLIHVRVYRPGAGREVVEARAVEIGDVITEYIAGNWTLGGLASLKKATVDGVELDGWSDDDGSGATLDIAVGLMSYLT